MKDEPIYTAYEAEQQAYDRYVDARNTHKEKDAAGEWISAVARLRAAGGTPEKISSMLSLVE